MTGSVGSKQRWKATRPCPICDGWDTMPRGKGRRCFGYAREDGTVAFCSREELAGRLEQDADTLCYPHRLEGECGCGRQHGPAVTRPGARDSFDIWGFETTYDYRDEEGKLALQVCRYANPKTFRQRVPTVPWPEPRTREHWEWKLGTTRLVLYRLPELMDADRSEPVWIVEGEKDADRLAAEGLVATTNPMGAGKWRIHYKEWLRGREVVILPDADEPGTKHARAVAAALKGSAGSVRVLELEHETGGADVSDWLDAGHTVAELRALIPLPAPAEGSPAGPRLVTIPSMHEVQLEEVRWLWYPYIPLGKFTLMEGDPGVRKSWLALAIAAAVSCGALLPSDSVKRDPARVLLLAGEDGLGDTVKPRLMAMSADLSKIRPVTGLIKEDEEQPMTLSPEGIAALITEAESYRPALVIIDPLVAYTSRDVDMNKANEVRSMLRPVTDMAQRLGVAIIALRHLNKVAGSAASYRGQGSIDYFAISRSVLFVGVDKSDPTRSVMAPNKSSLTRKGPGQAFRIGPGAGAAEFLWDGEVDTTVEDLLATPEEPDHMSVFTEAKSFLQEILFEGPVAGKEVQKEAREAGISERTLWRAKSELKVHAAKAKSRDGAWLWSLPHLEESKSAKAANSALRENGWQSGRLRGLPYKDSDDAEVSWMDERGDGA